MMGAAPRGIETPYIIISPDKQVTRGVIIWPRKPPEFIVWKFVERALRARAPVKHIRLKYSGAPSDMFIETGPRVSGEVNPLATALYHASAVEVTSTDLLIADWRAAAAKRGELPLDTLPVIHGTVVIFPRRVVWR